MKRKSSEISSILTKAILDRRLLAGDKLGERELSEIFGVSRIIVRQALIALSENGLVRVQRNKGAFVAQPNMQEALDVFDALTVMEQSVAESLAGRISPSALSGLQHIVLKQRQAAEDGNDALAEQLGRDFHKALIRLGQNRVIEEMHTQLSHRASLLTSLYIRTHDTCTFVKDHDVIIELIEKGEGEEAKRLIQSHNHMIARSFDIDGVKRKRLKCDEALKPYIQQKDISKTVDSHR